MTIRENRDTRAKLKPCKSVYMIKLPFAHFCHLFVGRMCHINAKPSCSKSSRFFEKLSAVQSITVTFLLSLHF